jgi:hypothetical protein
MQMGRWFGYRKGYDDICRIWMDAVSQDWYRFISEATDELREEVKRMRDSDATPLDFGLKVREDPDIPLIVTAKNKMRTAKAVSFNVSLSESVIETPFLPNDAGKNNKNLRAVTELMSKVHFEKSDGIYGAKDVNRDDIVNLLNSSDLPVANIKFEPQSISRFISQYAGAELLRWDVAIKSGDSTSTFSLQHGISINPSIRAFELTRDNKSVKLNRRRLGSQGDTKFGLSSAQLEMVKERVRSQERSSKNINDTDYFAVERKPLLLIYFIEPNKDKREEHKKLVDFESVPLIGFSIGIPPLGNVKTKYITYQTNKIHQELGGIEDYEDESE